MRATRYSRAAGCSAAARGAVLIALLLAAPLGAAEGPDISGVVETRASGAMTSDYGDGPGASYGLEQYVNLRLKARVGEFARSTRLPT
jgi:hypothetical protein